MRGNAVIALAIGLSACGRVGFDPLAGDSDGGPVSSGLALEPSESAINLGSQITFRVTGGAAPYTFSIASGDGAIDEYGVYTAGGYPGTTVVAVVDDAGNKTTANVDVGGALLVYAGGQRTGAAISDVWHSDDGIAWTMVGNLPAARSDGELFVYKNELMWAGGGAIDNDEGPRADIWKSTDGVQWTSVGSLPEPVTSYALVVHDGRIWIAGGITETSGSTPNVWSSDDAINWTPEPPLAARIHGSELVSYNGRLLLVAGHEPGAQSAIVQELNGTAWEVIGSVEFPGEYHGVTVYDGEIWLAGGLGYLDGVASSADGQSWTDQPMLPNARQYAELVEFKGKLWLIGGGGTESYRLDGTQWTSPGSFPGAVSGGQLTQFSPSN